ncbi:MAG: hypothetical protein J6T10_28845 [Methanobrevibacter sp.]|jgi:hypothetical protein|nr:hypothetical protein [Methanobrevibacter sp.]
MRIKENLLTLHDMDIWSLIFFALYKLKDIPEYSTISEMAYVLDKDNLLKLCEYFGGLTIKIPTIDELELLVHSLVLYQYVNIDGMDYEKAIEIVGKDSVDLRAVKSGYIKICEILSKYKFSPRGD